MKKIIAIILAGLLISPVLAGCELPDDELDHIIVSTVETTAPAMEAVPETLAPTEPAPDDGWAYGDEVWFVEWSEGGGWPYPGVVVEAGTDYLVISRGWDTNGELIVAHLDDCYRTYDEAWAATGKTVVAGEGCC